MATKNHQARKEPTSYELLGMRIQRLINRSDSQASKSALLVRFANDDPGDWDRMLEEIAENDNVSFAHRDDGGVQIFWTTLKED